MQLNCTKCGSPLGDGLNFCTACGAPRAKSVEVAEEAQCAECATPLRPDLRFCTGCGRPVVHSGQMRQAQAVQVTRWSSVPAADAPQIRKSSSLGKILIAAAALIVLAVAVVIGAGAYIGYRIKKKAEHIEQAYKSAIAHTPSAPDAQDTPATSPDFGKLIGAISQATQQESGKVPDMAKILEGLGSGQAGSSPDLTKILGSLGHSLQGDANQDHVEKRPTGSCPASAAAVRAYIHDGESATVPLQPGLTLTDVWTVRANQPDIEVLTSIDGIAGDSIRVTGRRLVGHDTPGTRNLCAADLFGAREYESRFGPSAPDTIPGATMFSVSRAEFLDLKAGRAAPFAYYDAFKNTTGGYDLRGFRSGTLIRAEANDVPYSIIVNGERKNLPTVHAKVKLGERTLEAWVLDDVANPIVLNFKAQDSPFHITYVKITYPAKKQVERQLAQTGHADIYGIYFDLNKATPRPESAPVLKEIAQALHNNPNWKLQIGGHTDNIGGNAYNLNLSEERAQGVMHSLVTQYGIAPDRLTAKGFGQTQPKATNDTPEGRALNRRVELVRN